MHLLISLISRFYIALTVLILTMITAFSLWPVSGTPVIPGSDKTHHLIAYAALMFPAAIRQHKQLWHIAIFFVCFSGAIELIQPYVNRYGELLDLAANAVGLLCGMLLARLFLFFAGTKTT